LRDFYLTFALVAWLIAIRAIGAPSGPNDSAPLRKVEKVCQGLCAAQGGVEAPARLAKIGPDQGVIAIETQVDENPDRSRSSRIASNTARASPSRASRVACVVSTRMQPTLG
jgi:hypothetical protein